MNCKGAKLLMPLYIAGESNLTAEENEAFKAHLQNCPDCAREYEIGKKVVALVKTYWKPECDEALVKLEKHELVKLRMTVEEGWRDLRRRCPYLAENINRRKSLQLILRIGAVTACLAVGVSVWLASSIHSKPKTAKESAIQQVAHTIKPFIRIELLSENGNVLIPFEKEIKTSGNEFKTLLINDKHQMVMNTNTTLSIEPLTKNNRLGCIVKLASGEIFTHVEHDGNPFIIGTTHSNAVITGTTFDMKVIDAGTTLVVTEGSVQFESKKGSVTVLAGYESEIVGDLAPTKPVSCNAADLTAWVASIKPETTLAKIKSDTETYNPEHFEPVFHSNNIDPESINYEDWVEKNRNWFKCEFQWIFQLKDALAKEGINADYPELLIKSGDVWQFVYPESSSTQIPVLNTDSLVKTASLYGFNKEWLLKNVPAAKSAIDNPETPKNQYVGLKAFEEWTSCLEQGEKSSGKVDSALLLRSLHAGKYLVNARTLAWLCLKNKTLICKAGDEEELSLLLKKEISAANNCTDILIQLISASPSPCSKECSDLIEMAVEKINALHEFEKEILTNESCN
jgi:hypothetical protein